METSYVEEVEMLRRRRYCEPTKIGSGTFGSAFLVKDSHGQTIVCKTIDISQGSRKEAQHAAKEAQLMASFRHPFIVECQGSFIDSGWLCIVMAYCAKGDLATEIVRARETSRPFDDEQILLWATQALLAIKYIHGRHVLHRDLKPSNFFLSSNYNLKMGDFGIAKVLSSTAACARTQTGTLNYLSPEVCQERPYTWPSDIWAMGVVLYEICTLRVPFVANNVAALVHKICRGPIPLPERSDVLRLLVSEMLNRTTARRPSAKAFLQWQAMKDMIRKLLTQFQEVQTIAEPVIPVPCYPRGARVEYRAGNGEAWIQATVIDVDGEGRVLLDAQADIWIARELQASLLRPESRTPPDSPRSAKDVAMSPTDSGNICDERSSAPRDWDDEVFRMCAELGIDQRGEYTPPDTDPETPPSELDDSFTADERALLADIG